MTDPRCHGRAEKSPHSLRNPAFQEDESFDMRTLGSLFLVFAAILLPLVLSAAEAKGPAAPAVTIHSVTDLSHEFSFYFDGRFAANYLVPQGGVDARNWATLYKAHLSNVNLLVLQSGGTPCPYLPEDIAAVTRFLEAGGGVVVLGDYARFRSESGYRLNDLVRTFGAEFVEAAAKAPLRPAAELGVTALETHGGKTLRLASPTDWEVLIRDAGGSPVAARKPVGRGKLLVLSRALSGRRPEAKDPLNASLWRSLLADLAAGKSVDPARRPRGMMPENITEKDGLRIQCSDYLQPTADAIFALYQKGRPLLEQILGVPPHEGMLTTLILLPTGGGGFSSGHAIGLGVWWGGFPEKRYGMVELLGHESTHSWVLPFPEPMWNEGMATYVGILLGRKMGFDAEADASLHNWIAGAKKLDPHMDEYDLARGKHVPHVVAMAKPMWIWEELRRRQPDALPRYFRAKRRLMDPAKRDKYTADDCVAVLGIALGRDLFPWFRSLGIDVRRERTSITGP